MVMIIMTISAIAVLIGLVHLFLLIMVILPPVNFIIWIAPATAFQIITNPSKSQHIEGDRIRPRWYVFLALTLYGLYGAAGNLIEFWSL